MGQGLQYRIKALKWATGKVEIQLVSDTPPYQASSRWVLEMRPQSQVPGPGLLEVPGAEEIWDPVESSEKKKKSFKFVLRFYNLDAWEVHAEVCPRSPPVPRATLLAWWTGRKFPRVWTAFGQGGGGVLFGGTKLREQRGGSVGLCWPLGAAVGVNSCL